MNQKTVKSLRSLANQKLSKSVTNSEFRTIKKWYKTLNRRQKSPELLNKLFSVK